MKILIAEDSVNERKLLNILLGRWGYETISTSNGVEALEKLRENDSVSMIIADWMMPKLTGIELCQKIRNDDRLVGKYIILLTSKNEKDDIVEGLEAGANDYITKPFDNNELRVRIKVGERVVSLQDSLAKRVEELENAFSLLRKLEGLLPICSYCKKIKNIKDDTTYWSQIESYIEDHSDASFTHSLCPDCYDKYVKPELEELKSVKRKERKD